MKLLHVDSSILGPGSVSRQLSAAIVVSQQALHPNVEIVYCDLAADPIGHLSGADLAPGPGKVSDDPAVAHDFTTGQNPLEQFLASDIVVVGAPMYNFTIPSQLKAWIDRLMIPGRTFRYTEAGPEGLAGGKTVIIASSRGGVYGEGTAVAFLDHQESYLRSIFGLVGITDIRFIRAEGIKRGDDERARAIAGAQRQIEAIAA